MKFSITCGNGCSRSENHSGGVNYKLVESDADRNYFVIILFWWNITNKLW